MLEQIADAIINMKIKRVRELTQRALDQGLSPVDIMEKGLIAGMAIVGDRMKSGEMYVPEVLMAAKAMSAGLEIMQPLLTAQKVQPRGTFVIGTVHGDLHSIGKNLVSMMLQGAGFQVIDLGMDVPAETFVATVREHRPDFVGLCALLTTTMPAMSDVIQSLSAAGLRDTVKVIVGGAPVSQHFADEIGADAYSVDAVSAVEYCKRIKASS